MSERDRLFFREMMDQVDQNNKDRNNWSPAVIEHNRMQANKDANERRDAQRKTKTGNKTKHPASAIGFFALSGEPLP